MALKDFNSSPLDAVDPDPFYQNIESFDAQGVPDVDERYLGDLDRATIDSRRFPESSLLQARNLGFTYKQGSEGAVDFNITGRGIAAGKDHFKIAREVRLQTTRPLIGDPQKPEVFQEHLFGGVFNPAEMRELQRIMRFGHSQHLLQFEPGALGPRVPNSMRNPWFSTAVDLEQLYARKLRQLIAHENLLIRKDQELLADMPKTYVVENIGTLKKQINEKKEKFAAAEAASPVANSIRVLNTDALILKKELQKLQQKLEEAERAKNTPKPDQRISRRDVHDARRDYVKWLGLVPNLPICSALESFTDEHAKQRAARLKIENGKTYKFLWFAQRLGVDGIAALALRDYVRAIQPDAAELAAQLNISAKRAKNILKDAHTYNALLEEVQTIPSRDFVKSMGYDSLYEFMRDGDTDKVFSNRINATERPEIVDYVIELAASIAQVTQIPLKLAIAPRKSAIRAQEKIAQSGDVNDLHRFSIIVNNVADVKKVFQAAFDDEATIVMEADDKFQSRPGGYYARHFRICQITGKRGQYPIEFKVITREAHHAQCEFGHPFYELRRSLGTDYASLARMGNLPQDEQEVFTAHAKALKKMVSRYERQIFEIAWHNDGMQAASDVLLSPMRVDVSNYATKIPYPDLCDIFSSLRRDVTDFMASNDRSPAAECLMSKLDQAIQALGQVKRPGNDENAPDPEEEMLLRFADVDETRIPIRRRSQYGSDPDEVSRGPEFRSKSGHANKVRDAAGRFESCNKFRRPLMPQYS